MAFLEQMHAGFGSPRAVVIALAERAARVGVDQVERVVRGYDNEVHRARLSDGRVVYVRIGRWADKDFAGEVWAMERARAAGVPVPEVLLHAEAVDGDRPAMVVAAAPGRQLDGVLDSLSPAQRRTAMVETGRTLALLHSVPAPGFWRPGADGRWPEEHKLRTGFVRDRIAEAPQLAAAGFSAAEIERTFALLAEEGSEWAGPPVVCHGDVSDEHVFVDEDLRVTCVIDWGMWCGGTAIGDLAYAAMVHPVRDFAGIAEGHGDAGDVGFWRSLGLSVVGLAIGNIAHHVGIGDPDGMATYVNALKHVLRAAENGWLDRPWSD